MSIPSWQLASRAKNKWILFEDIAEACFCPCSFQLSRSSQDHTLFKNFQLLHNKELLNDTCRRINFNCTELSNILCVSFTTPSDRITAIEKRSGLSESRTVNEWPLDSFSFVSFNPKQRPQKRVCLFVSAIVSTTAREKHAFVGRFSVY